MRQQPQTTNLLVAFSAALATASLLGCGEPRADTPPVSSARTSEASLTTLRVPFELYGHPGPWWRDNATQGDFDKDMWHCKTVSKRARKGAPSETRKEAAYRAFLDCMTSEAWTRGYPPRVESDPGH